MEARIDSKLDNLSENLANSLHASMLELFKDMANKLFSTPSQVPVSPHQRSDPSPAAPHKGKVLGGIQEEQVLDGSRNRPDFQSESNPLPHKTPGKSNVNVSP